MKNFLSVGASYKISVISGTIIFLFVSFIFASYVSAKYVSIISSDFSVSASTFRLSSDSLNGGATALNGSFDVELYNHDLSDNSSYDITYSVSATNIQTVNSTTITISDDKSGTLLKDQNLTATISVTPSSDILSFDLVVTTTNGFYKTMTEHYGKAYTVTFDKQSGTGGTNSVTAIYDYSMPEATAPTRVDYVFEGYFSGTNGTGTMYYDQYMDSSCNWNVASNTTLYANWVSDTQFDFVGGDGTSGNPYQIVNWFQLDRVREDLTAFYILNNSLNSSSLGYVELAGEYAHQGAGWAPIAGAGGITRFIGGFNGNNYTVSDLYIDRPTTDNVGLFGHIGISEIDLPTTIQKVKMASVDVTGARGTGALVGRVTGNRMTVIQYCSVSGGTVTGTGATGGLVGSNNSFKETGAVDRNPRMLNCSANVSVYGLKDTSDIRTFEKIGGLVGCSQKGTVQNCYSHSSVYADDTVQNVGGLVGCNIFRGFLITSYSTGSVTVNSGTAVGGFIGRVSTEGGHVPVTGSYWDKDTSGYTLGIGSGGPSGEVGLNTTQMQGSAAATNMTAFDFTNVWQTQTGAYPTLRDPS